MSAADKANTPNYPWSTLTWLSGGAAMLSAWFGDSDAYLGISFGVLAVIFGVRALRQFDSSKERGRWLAIISVVIGILATAAGAIDVFVRLYF